MNMATSEQFFMATQALQNFEGLRNDIRTNALAYQNDVASSRLTVAQTQQIAREDAVQYKKRLKWVRDILDAPARKTRLLAGLAIIGVTETEMGDAYAEMISVANPLATVTWTDAASVNTTVGQILAAVPAHDRVF